MRRIKIHLPKLNYSEVIILMVTLILILVVISLIISNNLRGNQPNEITSSFQDIPNNLKKVDDTTYTISGNIIKILPDGSVNYLYANHTPTEAEIAEIAKVLNVDSGKIKVLGNEFDKGYYSEPVPGDTQLD